MTSYAPTFEFPLLPRFAPRLGELGPRWSVLAIWALFAIVAAGGLGASLARPSPATKPTAPSGVAEQVPRFVRWAEPGDLLEARLVGLKLALAADANDGASWLLLAHTHGQLGHYAAATAAYRQASFDLPPDAALLADWADAQVMAKQGQWDDEARLLVERALALDSRQLKALALAGSEAFARGQFGLASAFWVRMALAAPAGSSEALQAAANLTAAQGLQARRR